MRPDKLLVVVAAALSTALVVDAAGTKPSKAVSPALPAVRNERAERRLRGSIMGATSGRDTNAPATPRHYQQVLPRPRVLALANTVAAPNKALHARLVRERAVRRSRSTITCGHEGHPCATKVCSPCSSSPLLRDPHMPPCRHASVPQRAPHDPSLRISRSARPRKHACPHLCFLLSPNSHHSF